MSQVVSYRVRPGDPPGSEKQPWLVIYLADDPIPEWAIVDSGSTHSLTPPHLAARIGLAYDRTQTESGRGIRPFRYIRASGSVKARTEFGQTFVLDRPVISEYPGFALLGRHDFFENFVLTFDQRRMRMEIARQPERLGFRPRTN